MEREHSKFGNEAFSYITGEKSTSKTEFIADFPSTPLILLRSCNVHWEFPDQDSTKTCPTMIIFLCAVNDFWSSTEHWLLWKEDAVNDWFHSHAKFTPRAARSHGWGVKACGSSFAEITEFLTQFQSWHRQNCSCSRAGISSSSSRTEAASALPNGTGALSKLHWSRKNPQLIPVQSSKLGHCRCAASGGVKILTNAPEIQLSVILSPTEQWCHTRINSESLK